MTNRINILIITSAVLIIGAFYFLIINWGISAGLIIGAIVLFILNHSLRKSSNRIKNIIGISIWITALIIGYQFSKRVILHIEGKPEKVFVITGEKNKQAIHSTWKWNNHIKVDSSYVIYTSSSLSQLNNIIIVDENGNEISGYGEGTSTQTCAPNSTLISLQTKYFEPKEGINENDKEWELSAYQMKKCK